MPTIDYTKREVVFRIAACGAPSVGKTTLLTQLHARLAPTERGELSIRAIGADQLVSFDCAATDLLPTGEYRARLHLFTIPGRIADPAIWRRMMTDVDGIIFIADSQFERIGESADALQTIAELPGMADAPVVLLYNKRDLPNAASIDYLDLVLNNATPRIPKIEGILHEGQGAAEALATLTPLMLKRVGQQEDEEAETAARFVIADTSAKLAEVPPPPPEPEPITPAPEPVERKHKPPTIEGECHCGAIHYRLLAPPREAPPHLGTPVVACAPPEYVILRGSAKEYGADNRTRTFCPECGTMLTFRDLASEDILIASATIEQ